MAKIKIKNSLTPGAVPAGLSLGEMAVNISDKKIFIGNAVEGVVTLHDQNNIITSVNGYTGNIFLGRGITTIMTGITRSFEINYAALGVTGLSFSTAPAVSSSDKILVQRKPSDKMELILVGDLLGTPYNISPANISGSIASYRFAFFDSSGNQYSSSTTNVQDEILNPTVRSFNGQTGHIQLSYVSSFNGQTGAVYGVSSINGATGAITNVAKTNVAQTFTQQQSFTSGLSLSSSYISPGFTLNSNDTDHGLSIKPYEIKAFSYTDPQGGNLLLSAGNVTIGDVYNIWNNPSTHNLTIEAETKTSYWTALGGSISLNSDQINIEATPNVSGLNSGQINLTSYTGGINLTTNNAGGINLTSNGGELKLQQTYSTDYFSIFSPYKTRIGDYDGCCDGMFIGLNEPLGAAPNTAGFYVWDWYATANKVFEITNNSGLSGSYIYMRPNDGVIVQSGATFTGNIYAPNIVTSVNGQTGAVTITTGSGGATGPTGSIQYNNGSGGFSGSSKLYFNSGYDSVEITTQRMLLGDYGDVGSGQNLFIDLNYDEPGYFKIFDHAYGTYPLIVSSAINSGSSVGFVTTTGNLSVQSGNIALINNGYYIQFPDGTTQSTAFSTNRGYTFTQLQRFNAGFNSTGATFTGNIYAPNIVTSVNGATGAITNIAVTNAAQTFSGMQSFSTGVSAATILAQTVGGDEGGQIDFGNPVTNTSLTGGVAIDIYQNKMRFFEKGGTSRGYYIDLSSGGAGAGTNLVGGGAGAVTSVSGSGNGILVSPTTGAVIVQNTGVVSFNGQTGAVYGVSSINGATGAITNVARLNEGNTFSVRQIMNAGISAANLTVNSGVTFNNIDLQSTTATVKGYNTGGYLKMQSFGTIMTTPGNPSIVLQDADNDIGGIPNITINPSPSVGAPNTLTLGNVNTATTLNGTLSVGSTSTFTGRSTHTSGITSANLYVSGGVTFNSTSSHAGLATFNSGITSSTLYVSSGSTFNGNISAPNIVNSNIAGTGISVSGATGNVTITNTGVQSFNGSTGAVTFNSYVSSFNGSTGAVTGVSSINGATGAVTNINAATVTVTSSNLNATRYLTFAYGAGDTGIFIDPTTTPLTYNPAGGAIGAKKLTLTTGPNVITVDSASPNMTLSDGTDIASFGPYQFSHNGTLPFDVSSNIAVAIGGPEIQFYGGWGAYYFPTSNGTTGQALFTNGDGILYWGTVSSGGGGSATGFTYAASAPGSPSIGDRWIDSDTGKEYVYVNDGSSSQWIEPVSSNGLVGVTYTSSTNFLEFGVTGSFVKLGVNNTSPQYTLDVNGIINAPVGISAGPITSSGATFSGAVVSDGGYRITSSAINAQTGTTYTLLTSDNGKIITMSNGSAITLTVPAGLPIGYNTTVIQLGAGQVGITASSTTLNSFEGKLKLAGQHAAASIISYTTNVFNVAGGLTA